MRTPTHSRAGAQRLDLTGAALLATALAVLVHALSGIPAHGWTTEPTWLGLAAVAGLAASLVLHERRTGHPIVPSPVARSVPVTASVALLILTTGGMFGALFVSTFFFQDVLGLGPLASGLRGLPLTVLMVLGAPAAAVALRRYGPRRTAVLGTVLVVLGTAGLSRLGTAGSWAVTGVAFAVLGAGFAVVMVTATATVVGEAPSGYAGVIGGLKQTAMNVGPTLGIAVAAGLMLPGPSDAGHRVMSASATGPTLLVLAGLAALALLPAWLLPTRPVRAAPDAPAVADSGVLPVGRPERSG